ncbi:MAG: hypothetical protein FIA99_17075 [Ruminiclostridium sp.]|nr:hypothetical protein [Ruminiclostridium sp.]
MKKFAFFLLIFIVLTLAVSPAIAEGISVLSESGDKVSLFEDIHITEKVNGNVIVILGNVNVDSEVNGIVVTVFGNANINARVSEQVVTVFGNSIMGEKAVTGNLITLGSVQKMKGSRISGNEVRILGEMMNINIGAILYLRVAILILFTVAVLLIGLLILVVYKKKFEKMTENVEQKLDRKLILGFLAYFGASILFVMLAITLIAPALYLAILILASITSSIFVGRLILKALNPTQSIIMEFITGLITITLVKLLLVYLLPQEEIILSLVLLGVFAVFINSLGLGIIMEARAAKK